MVKLEGGVETKMGRKGANFARFWLILEGSAPPRPLLDRPLLSVKFLKLFMLVSDINVLLKVHFVIKGPFFMIKVHFVIFMTLFSRL